MPCRLKLLREGFPWEKCERSSNIWLTCSPLSTKPNFPSAGEREYEKKNSFLAGGISNCFSPFPSWLCRSNFAQIIPPATQASGLVYLPPFSSSFFYFGRIVYCLYLFPKVQYHWTMNVKNTFCGDIWRLFFFLSFFSCRAWYNTEAFHA